MLFHASITRCQEFHKLSALVIERTLHSKISGGPELGKGVLWSYFFKDYQCDDGFVYPSLLGRVVWIVGGLLTALLLTISNLMSNIFMFKSPSTWGQWGKQLGICLARDGLEILSYPVAIFNYQYARYLVDCHQLQKFCLVRVKDQQGKNEFLGQLIKKLIDENNINTVAFLDSISYVDLVGAVGASGLMESIHTGPLVQQKFINWVNDTTWIETDFSRELETKLSALRDSLKYIISKENHDQQITNALVYLEKEKRAATWMGSLVLLLRDIQTKKEWCVKVYNLKHSEWEIPDFVAFERIQEKARIFMWAEIYLQAFEKKQKDLVESQQYIDELIKKNQEMTPQIVEFGDCLVQRYKEDKVENLLCLKYAYKIFLHYDYGRIDKDRFLGLDDESVSMIRDIAKQIAKDLKSDWKELLKLEWKLDPQGAVDLTYETILNILPIKTGKEISSINNEDIVKVFKLLDDVDLSRENFQKYLGHALNDLDEGIAKIYPLYIAFKNLLPKDKIDVKKMVEINPKFLRYCHPDIFKDKNLLLEIAIENIYTLTLANIPLHTIPPLNRKVLESFRCFFLCNHLKKVFPKPIAYKIFAHVPTLK